MIRFLLPLLALCAMAEAQAQCQITQAQVEATSRVFMHRQGNVVTLKRTASSPVGETLDMWCSRATTRAMTCRAGNPPRFNPPLPMNCTINPGAIVTPVRDGSCPQPASMYRVGYNLGNQQFAELYRVCYNRATVRPIFVEHRIYPKPFNARRPCTEFTADGVIGRADEGSFFTGSIYSTFRRLFGANQQYIANNRTVLLSRGHLAASNDFLFRDQMCATFKLVNVAPQFNTINARNWNRVEDYVRSLPRGNTFVSVRTGTRGVLSLPSPTGPKDVTLSGNKNPVPLWFYKIVHNARRQPIVAFLTLNNRFATRPPAVPNFCTRVACPNNMQFPQTGIDGYTTCCNPATFRP
ncbi:uncharacterized protein [Drosophila bipectinata]|uniref:uncharacterized protein n=1 Tax=Drosophila bipectinata TaxID=42026 RepID=UPI0038B35A23